MENRRGELGSNVVICRPRSKLPAVDYLQCEFASDFLNNVFLGLRYEWFSYVVIVAGVWYTNVTLVR